MADGEQEISTNQRLMRVPEQLRAHAYKPGISGNPGGRLAGTPTTITGMVKQALAQGATDEIIASKVIEVLLNPSHRHWMATLRETLDRLEGKASDHKSQLHKQISEGIELRDGRSDEPVPLPLEEGPEDLSPGDPDPSKGPAENMRKLTEEGRH